MQLYLKKKYVTRTAFLKTLIRHSKVYKQLAVADMQLAYKLAYQAR